VAEPATAANTATEKAAVAPDGRLIAVSFSDPAWQGGPLLR
jgi:hypothetical protein